MAKSKTQSTSETTVVDVVEVDVVENNANLAEAATIVAEEPVIVAVAEEPTEKLRTCVAKENHSCTIGGTKYVMSKDKTIQLPASVAAILSKANIIYIK